MKKWIFYVLVLGVASYWTSNLILWFPWSYSTTLGITLMLTVAPLLWAYVTYLALTTYPGSHLLKGCSMIAVVFLLHAVIMDYVFFGIIRDAMVELYHPTTFYGYGFLIVWPFILALILKRKISKGRKPVSNRNVVRAGMIGLICFGALTFIIQFGIEI